MLKLNKMLNNYLIQFILLSVFVNAIVANVVLPPASITVGIMFVVLILFITNNKICRRLADSVVVLLFLFIIYFIFQGFVLKLDVVDFLQPIVIILLYLVFYLYGVNKSFNLVSKSKTTSEVFIFVCYLLPLMLVTLNPWNGIRLAGLMANPNLTAHFSLFVYFIGLLGIRSKRNQLIAFSLIASIVIFTGSRSAFLALILGVSTFLFFKNRALNSISSFIVLALSYLISKNIIDVLMFFLDITGLVPSSRLLYNSYNGRDILLDKSLEMLNRNPWFGIGSSSSKIEIAGEIYGTHNGFLDLTLKHGYIGLILFICLILIFINKIVSNTQNKSYASLTLAVLVVVISLSTNSSIFLNFNFYFFYFLIVFTFATTDVDKD